MHAFLFNARHVELEESFAYGPPCAQREVKALGQLDPPLATRLHWGDVMPEALCYRLSQFEISPKTGASKSGYTSSSSEEVPDYDLYMTVVCDLAETLAAPPSTTSEATLLATILRSDIWAFVTANTNDSAAAIIDTKLRGFAPYLGMSKLDPGNPLHRRLMVDFLFHERSFFDGRGIVERVYPGIGADERRETELLARELFGSPPGGIALAEWDEFDAIAPALSLSEKLSERGALTEARVTGKAVARPRERLAHALFDHFGSAPVAERIAFKVGVEAGVSEVEIDPRKFTEYLLNHAHPEGQSKAKFFADALGIEASDWRFLASQIERGMKTAPVYRVGKNEWGFSHGALVVVEGRNGQQAVIETGWHVKPAEPARFITAYPYEAEAPDLVPPRPSTVPSNLVGEERWEAIFELATRAGSDAAREAQPTPMHISGIGTEWEGKCGYAWTHLPDGRKPMARWLVKAGHARRYSPGVAVWAKTNSQSVDRNRAYADAFTSVLRANGIDCSTHWRLD